MKRPHLILLIAASFLLASCSAMSLADDIAPPPGSQQETFASTNAPPTSSGPLYPLVAPDPKSGAAIFAEKCAPCHGDTGKGDGPQAAQLPNPAAAIGSADVARRSTPAEWYSVVTRGNMDRFMPPFPSLSDRQRWDVIAYVYSLSAEDGLGAQVYQDSCAACHGEAGRGNGPQAAVLNAALPDFTDQAYMAKKSNTDFYQSVSTGLGAEMPPFAGQLDDQELWAVSDYLRSISFTPAGQMAQVPQATTPGEAQTETAQSEGEPAQGAEPGEGETGELIAEPGFGIITGQVINGSGTEPLEALTVTLHGFDGMQVVVTDTVTTDAAGMFSFENVEMPANRIYLATANLNDATYASTFVPVEEGTQAISLDITVYQTTTDTNHLVTDRMHIFLDFSVPEVVQVIELYIMSNVGSKTIVAEQPGGPVVFFTLPEGAENLQFQEGVLGERYLEVPGGFADTLSLPPTTGEYQVLFGYELPYTRSRMELKRVFNTTVDSVVLLQPESGVKVKSDQLSESGPRSVQGVNYQMYMGGPFDVGGELVLSLSGNQASGLALADSTNQSLIFGLGAFGVVMIAAGVWLYSRNKSNELDEDENGDEIEAALPAEEGMTRESLIDAIVALDDLYQEGELPEEAYLERRAELKARLKDARE
jgi:mono/diheme cytochrome c family protein